ncbi:hypothetical protein MKW92_025260 [Papaver armeniacum]|nr:hypothetical protein MKW92_025260 [Papaver armeniacum]
MVPTGGRRRRITSKEEIQFEKGSVFWWILFLFSSTGGVECQCRRGCDLALASYNVWAGSNMTFISQVFDTTDQEILKYNPPDPLINIILLDKRLDVPFTCDCIGGERLGHVFTYTLKPGDTYEKVIKYYANLTSMEGLVRDNSYNPINILEGSLVNVTVNCSCGDEKVSDYELFVTYPLLPRDDLYSISEQFRISRFLLQRYNPSSDFSSGKGLVFIPGRDETGNYRRFRPDCTGGLAGAIVGIAAGIAAFALLAVCTCVGLSRRKKAKKALLLPKASKGSRGKFDKSVELASPTILASLRAKVTGITVDKSVEFTYEELARATDDFSLDNKIGQGGFGAVYYAEVRGEKAAIKKMDMQASKEFLAELKVLTRVHHLNLVRLIGYCVEDSLFLVYEFIDSGNLSEHLRGIEKEPLPWSTRLHIALDSARGLEYIHEHTVPVYIHRDIKSANILVDKNFRGKVADFGLTKLSEVGSGSLQTRVVGTFGYMPPEYVQWGEITHKVDVYALGGCPFEEVLNQPGSDEDLCKLVDPRLGDDYPFDSVRKLAQLAKACTQENPQLRPTMRSTVVALMTLSSSTEDWDVGSFYENRDLVNLMSGK